MPSQPAYPIPGYDSVPDRALFSALPQRQSYYETHYPLYCADWTAIEGKGFESIALSSFREDTSNKLQVVHGVKTDDDIEFFRVAEVSVNYPITKLQWDPSMAAAATPAPIDRLAAAAECLRIYEIDPLQNNALVERLTLTNAKHNNLNALPPLTAFDWNKVDPGLIITSSIDTTCTVWDIRNGGVAKTQLIAHDSEVFDVQFTMDSTNVFASVGNDGSVRVFDLRSLEHSTIIYEPVPGSEAAPLVRLATSHANNYHMATVVAESLAILVLDMRYPGVPVATLEGHSAPVNDIKWHPTKNWLLSGGDDCQALVWDCTNIDRDRAAYTQQGYYPSASPGVGTPGSPSGMPSAPAIPGMVEDTPILAYYEAMEVNNVCWDRDGSWFGAVSGKGFQAVKL
ncbi:hypothetical protein BABINDRAFT_159496 [Babjeviella inositovora NRRL Y-12698]|uniref:Uncharacterized protein n=1 Tax=Babjeviella inositovora NRRL Y-12698 TaxID=984486 RepID=A0A1E3QZH8_9ASCO|nr:uncharacterized protein BABINDRAFT_159496 [Babjeviella inositovora NRRL Y-12698]ODQ83021.1 hypothetical protein BABINDRAFT_159496 [Babjeviella inositovora NRRL Y-12698]